MQETEEGRGGAVYRRISAIALVVLLVAGAAARAESVAPPCKNGAATCMPWERDWSNTTLSPGSVVTGQGVIYAPPANPIVNFLYNWQTLLGGGLAIIAAIIASVVAYLIGSQQARETRRAADIQAAVMNAELEALKAGKAEEDCREREDLLAALDTETARIAMLAEMMRRVADREGNPAVARAASYKISVGPVLREGRGIPTLVHGKIRLAVIHLLASIEQLNALIDTKGLMLNELGTSELIEALDKIQTRNDELQEALGEYGGNRRIV